LLKSYYPEKVKHYLCAEWLEWGELMYIAPWGKNMRNHPLTFYQILRMLFLTVYISFLRIHDSLFVVVLSFMKIIAFFAFDLEPPYWIRIQLCQCIHIRISDPDPVSQKNEDISCFEALQVLSKRAGLFSSRKMLHLLKKKSGFFSIVNLIHFYFIFKKKPES
jgi:hypothetical protein